MQPDIEEMRPKDLTDKELKHLMVAWQSPTVSTTSGKYKLAPPEWEYKALDPDHSNSPYINAGLSGWEMCGVCGKTVYFKRLRNA